MEVKIYQKENKLSLFKLLKESLHDIYSSRFLARQLAERDIKAQYRQSYFGILWAFLTPLVTAFVWIILNKTGTIKLTDAGMPYPLFAFSGTLMWSIITDSINSPLTSTNGARAILTKINFPKEALIVSGIYKLLFNTAIKLMLLIIFIIYFNVAFTWYLVLIPFVVLGAVLFGTTIGLFITPIGLLYGDVNKLIAFALKFLMYVTPVVYVIPKAGIMKTLMELNPMSSIILTVRELILGVEFNSILPMLIILLCCIPLVFLGLIIYRISIPIIVERLSA